MSVEFSETEWKYEPVQASTLAGVADAISQMEEAAKTEWFPAYKYDTTDEAVSGAVVTVKTKVTMPLWSGYTNVSQGQKDEWDRFMVALRTHEQGHLDLVSEGLSNVDGSLVGLSVNDAKKAWADALDALRSASDAYDAATDHGRNEGTIIDAGVS